MEKIIHENDMNYAKNNTAICYWRDQIDLLTSNTVTNQNLPFITNKNFSQNGLSDLSCKENLKRKFSNILKKNIYLPSHSCYRTKNLTKFKTIPIYRFLLLRQKIHLTTIFDVATWVASNLITLKTQYTNHPTRN